MHLPVKQQYATIHQGFLLFTKLKILQYLLLQYSFLLIDHFSSRDTRLKLPSLPHFISSFLISINSETSPSECSVCPFSTCVPWICFCKTKEFCLSEREIHRKWIRRCHWSYTGWRGWQLFSRWVKNTFLAAGIIEL